MLKILKFKELSKYKTNIYFKIINSKIDFNATRLSLPSQREQFIF